MIMSGCQGKPKTPTIEEKICPNCGSIIEIFSCDTDVACDKCGFVAYNEKLSCVQWCEHARECMGDEVYAQLMKVTAQQKAMREAERQAQREAKARAAAREGA